MIFFFDDLSLFTLFYRIASGQFSLYSLFSGRDDVFNTCSLSILTKASRGKRKARAQPEQCKSTVRLLALLLILSYLF